MHPSDKIIYLANYRNNLERLLKVGEKEIVNPSGYVMLCDLTSEDKNRIELEIKRVNHILYANDNYNPFIQHIKH
jgi:hypothetical protein